MDYILRKPIASVRRKVQFERLIRGGAVVLGYCLFASFVVTFLLARSNFSDTALFWSRILAGAGLALLLVRYVVLPLLRKPSDEKVARFLEERFPDLNDRLATAVEMHPAGDRIHPEILALVQRDARDHLRRIEQPRFYWPKTSFSSVVASLIITLTFLAVFFNGPAAYRYGLGKMVADRFGDGKAPLYQVVVAPGNVTVAARADLQIKAEVLGFEATSVDLFARYETEATWEQTRMAPETETGQYSFRFFDVREPVDYYVEADGIRSQTFRIDVSDVPRVTELKIRLEFPAYTAMSPVLQEENGNLRALKGTTARFSIKADQPVSQGVLGLELGEDVILTKIDSTTLEGSFKIVDNDFYRIFLSNSEGIQNPGSDEYFIEAIEDQPPKISFAEPGRDRRVTNLEEVFTEVKAEDDHGLRSLTLSYSVNGNPEEKLQLDVRRGSVNTTAAHTFYLEEWDLEPGDFISYYATARDALDETATDMFFMEVQPYDREFYQSQQGGGSGSGQSGMDLARQQKEIIVATFALVNDKDLYTASEFKENSQTLALIQQRLQSQAQTIIDRIERRGAAAADPRFRKMVEYMRQALEHMAPAEKSLNEVKPAEALPEEQKAYQQMLRAEALFNEMQVSMSQNSGSSSSASELADLVDLELDRTKNQYETLQQNRELQQDQALDEALEKLKDLARRQQQQVERQRQQGTQSSSGSASQEQLIEEVERLARELARLSRKKQDPELQQIGRELERAAREMRQGRQSGQNDQEAAMRAQQALERLKKAQEDLNRQRQSEMRSKVEQLRNQAEDLAREENEVVEGIKDLERKYNAGQFDQDQWRNLLRKKEEMQQDLQGLEGELHQTAKQIESREPEAARKLKEAGLDIRDERLTEKMMDGTNFLARALMNMARRREEGVEQELQALAQTIKEAEEALGEDPSADTPEERLREALGQVGSLVDRLESLKERAENMQQGQQQTEQTGDPAQQGQEQNEQQGQEQGQQQGEQQGEQAGERAGSEQRGRAGLSRGRQPVPQEAPSSPFAGGPINPRQTEREWRERVREAEEMRDLLKDHRDLAGEADRLVRQMRQLDASRIYSDEAEVERLKSQILIGFHELELRINRLLQEELGNVLRLANESDVPPEFRDRVEEYYRRLSQKKPKN